jgi:hypothetical protein
MDLHTSFPQKENFTVTDFFLLYFIGGKMTCQLLFKRVLHLDTGDTEREHKMLINLKNSTITFRYLINNGISWDRFRQAHMMHGFCVHT